MSCVLTTSIPLCTHRANEVVDAFDDSFQMAMALIKTDHDSAINNLHADLTVYIIHSFI